MRRDHASRVSSGPCSTSVRRGQSLERGPVPRLGRRRLGLLNRIATRTLRTYVQVALGEREAVAGVIACMQTFGSRVHVHSHLHVRMTDGAFRHEGSFVPIPTPDPAVLEEVWRRSVLAELVRRGWLEEDEAAGMLG